MKVRNIVWDTYDPSEESVSQEELDLPSEVEIPEDVVKTRMTTSAGFLMSTVFASSAVIMARNLRAEST